MRTGGMLIGGAVTVHNTYPSTPTACMAQQHQDQHLRTTALLCTAPPHPDPRPALTRMTLTCMCVCVPLPPPLLSHRSLVPCTSRLALL